MKITKMNEYSVVRVFNDKNELECLFLTDHELKRIRTRSRTATSPKKVSIWGRLALAWRLLLMR